MEFVRKMIPHQIIINFLKLQLILYQHKLNNNKNLLLSLRVQIINQLNAVQIKYKSIIIVFLQYLFVRNIKTQENAKNVILIFQSIMENASLQFYLHHKVKNNKKINSQL